MTKLNSGLPKDPGKNGLAWIGRDLLNNPQNRHIMLAVVDCSKITTDTDTGSREPTARVLRIERVHPDDVPEVERLVRRALEHRMGDTVLPLDVEREIDAWLGEGFRLNPETGELEPVHDETDPDGGPRPGEATE
jgi:hypothetical protein